jgi:hypothetical protein
MVVFATGKNPHLTVYKTTHLPTKPYISTGKSFLLFFYCGRSSHLPQHLVVETLKLPATKKNGCIALILCYGAGNNTDKPTSRAVSVERGIMAQYRQYSVRVWATASFEIEDDEIESYRKDYENQKDLPHNNHIKDFDEWLEVQLEHKAREEAFDNIRCGNWDDVDVELDDSQEI